MHLTRLTLASLLLALPACGSAPVAETDMVADEVAVPESSAGETLAANGDVVDPDLELRDPVGLD